MFVTPGSCFVGDISLFLFFAIIDYQCTIIFVLKCCKYLLFVDVWLRNIRFFELNTPLLNYYNFSNIVKYNLRDLEEIIPRNTLIVGCENLAILIHIIYVGK